MTENGSIGAALKAQITEDERLSIEAGMARTLPCSESKQEGGKFMKKRESGFTLIELLIVIAIIGILAAIAIPNLLNAVQRGKQKRTMSDMRALATAIEATIVLCGPMPETTAGSTRSTT